MTIIAEAIAGAATGIMNGANGLVKSIFGSREQKDAAISGEQQQILSNYAAEFTAVQNRTYFDSFVDGANRLVRPFCTYGSVALVGWACMDPINFALAMQSLALVPTWLWSAMAGILAFWFGSRMLERVPGQVTIDPSQMVLAKELVAQRTLLLQATPPAQVPQEPARSPVESVAISVTRDTGETEELSQTLQEPPQNDVMLLRMLMLHEGWRPNKYRCSKGKLTVGYGHNLDANPLPGLVVPLSKEKGLEILKTDLDNHRDELFLTLPWVKDLDEVRQACLIDMTFNMGLKGLQGFTTSLSHVRSGRYPSAARSMRKSKWFTQVGNRSVRICKMMETGEWAKDI